MWKVVVRGIRESFERRACRTNVYSQSSSDTSSSSENNKLAHRPKNCCVAPNFYVFFHGFCDKNGKHLGPKDKENDNKYDPKYTWSEAVGLSSILAVGYIVCQSLCVRRRLFEVDNKNFERWRTILISSPAQFSKLLENTFALPSWERGILPISSTSHEAYDPEKLSEKKDDISSADSSSGLSYGPLTAEDTYKEAEDEFLETHKSLISELELNSGLLALEEERYEEAVEHFTEGTRLSSASNMFNLALCYELGLGTTKNYEKAAELYEDAANRGHTDAMYNLGIFHAQGKGGLAVNLNNARQLFRAAANKGHVLALEALELEKSQRMYPTLQENIVQSTNDHLEIKTLGRNIQKINVIDLMNHNVFSNFNEKYAEADLFFKSVDENSKNPTEIFLSMLGLKERNAMSIVSAVDGVS